MVCTFFLVMRCPGAATLIAATTRPEWSRIGAATQRSPDSISSSSMAYPFWRMDSSSAISAAGSVMVFGV